MITSMHIKNFKCFKDFDIELGKFNVLVGPNGSGKSSLLTAVRIAAYLGPQANHPAFLRSDELRSVPYLRWTWMKRRDLQIAMRIYGEAGCGADQPHQRILSRDGWGFWSCLDIEKAPVPDKDKGRWLEEHYPQWYSRTIGRVAYHSFEPGVLKCASLLTSKITATGQGFPGYLSHILNTERSVFDSIEREFCRRFPEYTALKTPSVNITPPRGDNEGSGCDDNGKGGTADGGFSSQGDVSGHKEKDDYRIFLQFQKSGDVVLEAADASDGHVVSLAFITLSCLATPPNILLVEEPENWIHHASLKDIIETLKHLSDEKDVQVILTTHSPYLLDLVQPKDVRVFTKDDEGAVHAAKLSDHPEVESLRKHFKTGEIWTGFQSDRDIVEKTGSFE